MRSIRILLLVGMVVVTLSGCVTASQSVPLPDLNASIDDESKARIYVLRPSSMGSAVPFNVFENDIKMGVLGPDSFLCWEREPGLIEISVKSENLSKVSLDVEAGNVYYIKANVQMGVLKARVKLETLDENTGSELVGKCKPVQQ